LPIKPNHRVKSKALKQFQPKSKCKHSMKAIKTPTLKVEPEATTVRRKMMKKAVDNALDASNNE